MLQASPKFGAPQTWLCPIQQRSVDQPGYQCNRPSFEQDFYTDLLEQTHFPHRLQSALVQLPSIYERKRKPKTL